MISVKRLRNDKNTVDEFEARKEEIPETSLLGKRAYESTDDDDQSEREEEIPIPEIFSRTM